MPEANAIPDMSAAESSDSINAPWDPFASEGAAPAQNAPATTAETRAAPAGTSNIVDPFAVMGDGPAALGEAPAAQTGAAADNSASSNHNIVDPFAAAPEQAAPVETATPATAAPVETAAPAATMTATDNAADKARIADLEKQLADLQKSLTASEKSLKQAQDDLSKKSEELSKAQADLKSAQKEAKDAAKAAPKAADSSAKADDAAKADAKPAAAVKSTPKAAAPAKRVSWTLRSAKPGMAWVSEKGSNEMRTVSVGDTLPGIGKVTSIATDAQGRWVVNGTRGSINQ
jgi:hypothetical protein